MKKQRDSRKKQQDEAVVQEEHDEVPINIITTDENKQDEQTVSTDNKEEKDEFSDLEKDLLGLSVSLFDDVFDNAEEE